jgi:hypothetical protein
MLSSKSKRTLLSKAEKREAPHQANTRVYETTDYTNCEARPPIGPLLHP